MKLKILSPSVHGILDYLAASALIVLPFILNLGDIALMLSVAAGCGLIVYSLLTDYRFGAVKALPFGIHLLLDLAAALAFIVAPFVFGFDQLASIYYFVMAGGVIAVVGLSAPAPEESPVVRS